MSATITETHGASLCLLAYSLTEDRHDAEQVVARVIAQVGSRPPPSRGELCELVYAACSGPLPLTSPDPSEQRSQLADQFDLAMERLRRIPRDSRVALALCVYGGLNYTQAAALLLIPSAKVPLLLSSGLRSFSPGRNL